MSFFVPSSTWQDFAKSYQNIDRHAGTFDDVCCLNSCLPLRGLYVSQISRYCLWTGELMNIYYMQYQNISTIVYYKRYQDIKILSMDRWTDEYSDKDDNNVVIRIKIMILFQPTEVFVNVMEGEGWGPKTPSENKTSVKVTSQRWWWWWWWHLSIFGTLPHYLGTTKSA